MANLPSKPVPRSSTTTQKQAKSSSAAATRGSAKAPPTCAPSNPISISASRKPAASPPLRDIGKPAANQKKANRRPNLTPTTPKHLPTDRHHGLFRPHPRPGLHLLRHRTRDPLRRPPPQML